MTVDELKSTFGEAGILLLQVEDFPERSRSADFTVKGTLSEYVAAAKAFQIPIVFLYTETLDEEDFLYNLEGSDEESMVDDEATLDLCSIDGRLLAFKEYVGKVGVFFFTAPMQSNLISYSLQEEWHLNFSSCWEAAVEEAEKARVEKLKNDAAHDDAENLTLLKTLHDLIDDERFARLRTQKAMMVYAIKHIPGLEKLGRGVLRSEIQELVAKIDARDGE